MPPAKTSFPIDRIWYDQPSRQRRNATQVDDLVASMSRIGLINPLVITSEGQLITGERRLNAAKELGWTKVDVRFRDDLTPIEQRQIELDENIRRQDLSWQDRCLAALDYHNICKELHGEEWTQPQSAKEIGIALSAFESWLLVGRRISIGDEQIINAPTFSTALGIIERSLQRSKADQEEELASMLGGDAPASAELYYSDEAPPVVEPGTEAKSPPPQRKIPILHLDFQDFVPKYRGQKFNFIHCDFPYGKNADKMDQGAAAGYGGYADSQEVFQELLVTFAKFTDTCVSTSAHLVFWFHMDYYFYTKEILTEMGWKVNPMPFIWAKSDNTGIIPDPKRGPRQIYETAFLASRGDRHIVRAKSNAVWLPTTKQYHMSEKPKAVLAHLFEMFVDESTRMIDPTCGSANSVVTANNMGAKAVLGLEVDKEFHRNACLNWKENVDE